MNLKWLKKDLHCELISLKIIIDLQIERKTALFSEGILSVYF